MENEKEIEIDFAKIFNMLKKRIVYIILGALITAVLAGCITEFFIQPKYSSSCKLYVYSNTDRVSTSSSVGVNELNASQQLVNTYIVAIGSDTVLQMVIDELNLNMTTSQLSSMITCSQIDETEFFNVTVTGTNAAQAADIANAVAKVAPEEIIRVLKVGGVEVLDYAKVPSSPSSPNLKRNIILGALAGFILIFAVFTVREIFDTTVTSEKDIEKEFDIPILGTIPRLFASDAKPSSENGKGGSK
ncbi:MAG: Wzz/FepE/Etk N-terminal domain-containing protein [Clostridiales bacterium]|nr:Wzz/FepE/Etk N-terminal domain-containing protein [Clostridiales bacterium]